MRKKIIVLALLLALVGSGTALFIAQKNDQKNAGVEGAESFINYGPPTEEEIKETEAHKDSLADQDKPSEPVEENGQKQVSSVISSANHDKVRAFVPGILEDDGICKARFFKGSISFTKQSIGFRNVNVTNCAPIEVSLSDFASSGTWSVVVSYQSDTATGSSAVTSFEVEK